MRGSTEAVTNVAKLGPIFKTQRRNGDCHHSLPRKDVPSFTCYVRWSFRGREKRQ
jgi:hypothetical protein